MKKVVHLIALTLGLTLSVGLSSSSAQPPDTCQVLCVTSGCAKHSDCTAEPNGRCDLVCPGNGCCVYN
jgi:hypothetical protein